jgi:hypothetical protein
MKKHYAPFWFWAFVVAAAVSVVTTFALGNWQAGLAWLLLLGAQLIHRLADQIIDGKNEVLALQRELIDEQSAYIKRLEDRLSR